jgi:hypothetical protein
MGGAKSAFVYRQERDRGKEAYVSRARHLDRQSGGWNGKLPEIQQGTRDRGAGQTRHSRVI